MSLSQVVVDRGSLNGAVAPSGADVVHVARLGLAMGRSRRVAVMNAIGARLLIPAGGFTGQAHLFAKGDLRLVGLLALMAHDAAAKAIAFNLARVVRYTDSHVLLALVTAAREHSSALTATSDRLVDSWHEGGLDFLWKTKDRLALPRAITSRWEPVPRFISPETRHAVYPAYIPARDQTVVYAAQISSSYRLSFKARVEAELGIGSASALASLSRTACLVWQAYAFLAPGGRHYQAAVPPRAQLGRGFGVHTALGYLLAEAREAGRAPDLERVLTDPTLNGTEWIRSAKTRVAETLFLERLLAEVRERGADMPS
jgi:hypothetical protein